MTMPSMNRAAVALTLALSALPGLPSQSTPTPATRLAPSTPVQFTLGPAGCDCTGCAADRGGAAHPSGGYVLLPYSWAPPSQESIPYYISTSFRGALVDQSYDEAIAAIHSAADQWTQQGRSTARLVFQGFTDQAGIARDGVNIVSFDPNPCPFGSVCVAAASIWYDPSTLANREFDIVVYGRNSYGHSIPWGSGGLPWLPGIRMVMAHEFGHVLGLDHYLGGVMQPSILTGVADFPLSDEDIAGVQHLYGSPLLGVTASHGSYAAVYLGRNFLIRSDPGHAGRSVVLLSTLSGTSPGFSIFGRSIPLNWDLFTGFLLDTPALPALATLQPHSRLPFSQADLRWTGLPVSVPGSLRGGSMHSVAVVLGPNGSGIESVSSPMETRLVEDSGLWYFGGFGVARGFGTAGVYLPTLGSVAIHGGWLGKILGHGNALSTWNSTPAGWRVQTFAGPAPRESHAMAVDPQRNEAVLFGGIDSTVFGDTWTLAGTSWQQRQPATQPGSRYGHAMAYDAARQRVILFGGCLGIGGFSDETWEWDGNDWVARSPANRPTARRGAVLWFDPARNTVMLFGGRTASGVQSDTWEWNGSNWTQLALATTPPARAAAMATYDSARQRAVLFGGEDDPGGTLADTRTWEWDGAAGAWQVVSTTGPRPRRNAALVFDPVLGVSVLAGGWNDQHGFPSDTWAWNGSSWQRWQ